MRLSYALPAFAMAMAAVMGRPASAADTWATSINDNGDVAGFCVGCGPGTFAGFTFSSGNYSIVDDGSTPSSTIVRGINNAGQVVGYSGSGAFTYQGNTFTPLINPLGTFTAPFGVSNSGEIVGWFQGPDSTHGFSDVRGVFSRIDDPNASAPYGTFAYGVNDPGVIVGTWTDNADRSHGFIDVNGTFSTLDDPDAGPTGQTIAYGVNDAGVVVGTFLNWTTGWHGFEYDNGKFLTIDLGNEGTFAYGINNNGDIVGGYVTENGTYRGYVDTNGTFTTLEAPDVPPGPPAPTPELSTWAMLILGLGMIGFAARRRNAGAALAA